MMKEIVTVDVTAADNSGNYSDTVIEPEVLGADENTSPRFADSQQQKSPRKVAFGGGQIRAVHLVVGLLLLPVVLLFFVLLLIFGVGMMLFLPKAFKKAQARSFTWNIPKQPTGPGA